MCLFLASPPPIPVEALGEQYKETFKYTIRLVCIFDGNPFAINRPGAPAKKKHECVAWLFFVRCTTLDIVV